MNKVFFQVSIRVMCDIKPRKYIVSKTESDCVFSLGFLRSSQKENFVD